MIILLKRRGDLICSSQPISGFGGALGYYYYSSTYMYGRTLVRSYGRTLVRLSE